MSQYLRIFLLVCLATTCYGYGTGAPEQVCDSMTPNHQGIQPQSTAAPFTVTTNLNKAKVGQPVIVTLKGVNDNTLIRGFLVQGRKGNTPVGSFELQNPKISKLLNCGQTKGSAVTHKSQTKEREVKLVWKPTSDLVGTKITFRATIAINGGTFWVGIQSKPVTIV